MLLLDSMSDAATVQENMHKGMVPGLGMIWMFIFLGICLVFAFLPKFIAFIKYICLFFCAIEIFMTIFFWFNPKWEIALQLLVAACFGLYALISTDNEEHMKWWTIFNVLNTLVVWGKVAILGYPTQTFLDSVASFTAASSCNAYYGFDSNEARCTSYVNFLQFMAFMIILIQPTLTFLGYLIWKGKGNDQIDSSYGAIGESET
eukprot:TRINITY_DN5335_c0_g2_i1.p1 TRINITY_DN5335_c0_g2~~TRINITY_DN5335_c0_g2_i1.p1  ORF type:complete len:204 (+),score=17.83 TRINITY_DN5335_c0_g2_i1:44-655(+)